MNKTNLLAVPLLRQ